MNIDPKVGAATGAASIAGAMTIILVWVLSKYVGVQIPDDVAQAATTILAGAFAFLGGYFTLSHPPPKEPPAQGS